MKPIKPKGYPELNIYSELAYNIRRIAPRMLKEAENIENNIITIRDNPDKHLVDNLELYSDIVKDLIRKLDNNYKMFENERK